MSKRTLKIFIKVGYSSLFNIGNVFGLFDRSREVLKKEIFVKKNNENVPNPFKLGTSVDYFFIFVSKNLILSSID
jgi:hypothetical protein